MANTIWDLLGTNSVDNAPPVVTCLIWPDRHSTLTYETLCTKPSPLLGGSQGHRPPYISTSSVSYMTLTSSDVWDWQCLLPYFIL